MIKQKSSNATFMPELAKIQPFCYKKELGEKRGEEDIIGHSRSTHYFDLFGRPRIPMNVPNFLIFSLNSLKSTGLTI